MRTIDVNDIIVTMTNWMPELESRSGPRYIAIADALSQDITEGRLQAGERLPTHRDLAWGLGVTVGTVSRAYAEAERRGLISSEVGRGTYVRAPLLLELPMTPDQTADAPERINLSSAFPPPSGQDPFVEPTLSTIAKDPQASRLFDYQAHAGLAEHRAAGALWLARSGVEAAPDAVIVTAGAQHAITVCLAALTRPGDRVLCESLTYAGLQTVARLLGIRLEGLACDEAGIRPEALAAACRNGDAKALYCIPTFQNPTTTIMPEARRREIGAIAEAHGLPVIEDDIFGLFTDERPPPLQSFAPALTYFLTSLSKSVAPGLRIGYIASPPGTSERLTAAVRATCWMAPPLMAEVATRWIRDGSAERILARHREEAEARRALTLDILGRWDPIGPPGSLFLWLHLPDPWRSSNFAVEAGRRGIEVTPAEAFTIGRQTIAHAIKISIGPPRDRDLLAKALRRLDGLIEAGPSESFGSSL